MASKRKTLTTEEQLQKKLKVATNNEEVEQAHEENEREKDEEERVKGAEAVIASSQFIEDNRNSGEEDSDSDSSSDMQSDRQKIPGEEDLAESAIISYGECIDLDILAIWTKFKHFWIFEAETYLNRDAWKPLSLRPGESKVCWTYADIFFNKKLEKGIMRLNLLKCSKAPTALEGNTSYKAFQGEKKSDRIFGITRSRLAIPEIVSKRWFFCHVNDVLLLKKVYTEKFVPLEKAFRAKVATYIEFKSNSLKNKTKAEGLCPKVDYVIKKYTGGKRTATLVLRLRASNGDYSNIHYTFAYVDKDDDIIAAMNVVPETMKKIFDNLPTEELLEFATQVNDG